MWRFGRHCFLGLPGNRALALWVALLPWLARARTPDAAGKPVVGQNANGELAVFKVDADGQLRYSWRKPANGDWSSWTALGGSFYPGMAVGRDAHGQLSIFAVEQSTHALKYAHQIGSNGPAWSAWAGLGGNVQPPLTVAAGVDGRLMVFADDLAGRSARSIHQTEAGGWSDWSDLGGNVAPPLAVCANRDGRLELFGITAGGHDVRHCWQLDPSSDSWWSPWAGLGGNVSAEIGVGRNKDGRLELFAVNAVAETVDRICQAAPGESARWTGWTNFYGANVSPGVVVAAGGDGRLEVFAINAKDSTLWHCWQMRPDGSDVWSGWRGMGWPVDSAPACGCNNDGNLELFAQEARHPGVLDYKRQISASSDWLDWERMGHASFAYAARTWQTADGLPNNDVQAIAQTTDGYLWVGTAAGLARFNGVSFASFEARTPPQIKGAAIPALCADRDGSLWIGADGGGLLRWKDGVFSSWNAAGGLAGDAVRVIYQSQDNSLWIGATTGMSRYKDGQFVTYTKKQGLLSDSVQCIFEDRDGVLWIGTSRGLNRLKDGKMDSFLMPKGIPNDSVRAICQDKGGRTWIGSNNGMLWYDWYYTGHFYPYNTLYGLSDSFVSALCEDRERNFWVGTFSGLNRFRDGRFYTQLNDEGMPFARINALAEDREGDLWAGSEEGLTRLTPKRFSAWTEQQGLTHNNVTSVMEDRQGSLWVGTWGGGLNELRDERVHALTATNGLADDLVLATCQGSDGSLWIGADFDGGLTRLKDGKLTHFGAADGLISAGIRALHEDRRGRLWIGTSRGLVCREHGKFTTYTVKDNLSGNAVRVICEDKAGVLWFGAEGGLSRWDDGRFVNFRVTNGLSDDTVTALYEDSQGSLWIGTQAGGLDRMRQGRFTAYQTEQGLFSDEIFQILEDDEGWLWMSCSKGIFRVRKSDFDAVDLGRRDSVVSLTYGKSDGMESPQCNGLAQPAGCKTSNGRLWFPTTKGLVVVDPKTVRIEAAPPPVCIEEVLADKEPVMRGGLRVFASGSTVAVPPGRGELEFHYAALSFQAPERCQFRYKLEGVDVDWINAGPQRVAHYNNIYPGAYQFHVMACNQDGVWSRQDASLGVVLAAHLWQAWWFRALAALAVIGTASGIARFAAVRRMRRRLALSEQRHAIERERMRIAKDIHDDLGSSLTRIMMLGERTEEGLTRNEDVSLHVNKIVASARGTVQALDEIVWAVNPENDTLDGLASYISHYADEFFENTSINCRLEMPVKLPAMPLKAEVRHDVFLVLKEAFNNSLKYSQATLVQVRVAIEGEAVRIDIEDNGCGFELNGHANGRKGNGLENMRRRCENLGGRFTVASAPGQGTQIGLTFRCG
ncbi:MAG TPA: two-component regulator propeller domain-containing protein [Verrucomicrobiae bacterium]|jgi:ligand-binding sensor domain-containing protein/signal transduction histidine kinase